VAKQSVKHEITALRDEIREHDRRYYVAAAADGNSLRYSRTSSCIRSISAIHPDAECR
jgi:NAD-dependent DNA ligase